MLVTEEIWNESHRFRFAKELRRDPVKKGVKTFPTALLLLLLILSVGCVHQHVAESVDEHAVIEGNRYASEVEAQSPFKPIEMSWREAQSLMKQRNSDYLTARAVHVQTLEETALIEELTDQVKDVLGISLGDLMEPDKLALGVHSPVTQLPKQLASVSKLKSISHDIEQGTWDKMERSVSTEVIMREQEVKLHRLLRSGLLIDRELACLERRPSFPPGTDPKFVAARRRWHGHLEKERDVWLDEVRDFFDAEYHDVIFVKDGSGLPTYESSDTPDLSEWKRWCRLRRSQELVGVLQKSHKKSKPMVPGSRMLTSMLGELFDMDIGDEEVRRKKASVRSEVRNLVRNWREMKAAQQKAETLEGSVPSKEINNLVQVGQRQTIYELRQREIKHASVVWMMDESCWVR